MTNIMYIIGAVIAAIVAGIYMIFAAISDFIIKSGSLLICIMIAIVAAFLHPFYKLHLNSKVKQLSNLGGLWIGRNNYPCINFVLTKFYE